METIEAILSRRSIRKFTNQTIDKETIELILKAAMYAPSAKNTQSWQFVVISDRKMLNSITKVHPFASMMTKASLAILVCGDKTLEPDEGYLNTNCSAATQNILLAAHALGIGSVWLGVYPREERIKGMIDLFGLPAEILPVSLIALGYSNEHAIHPERFKKERIHYEKWQGEK
jgi:nitroreductase